MRRWHVGCLLVATVVLSARAPAQGRGNNSGRASDNALRPAHTETFTVVLEFRRPYRENADAFIAATGWRLYGHVEAGHLSTELSRGRLRDVLGLTFTLSVVRGAGNSKNTDAYVAKIRDPRALKAEFKPLLREVWINTDPKREVGEGDPEYRPSRQGRRARGRP